MSKCLIDDREVKKIRTQVLTVIQNNVKMPGSSFIEDMTNLLSTLGNTYTLSGRELNKVINAVYQPLNLLGVVEQYKDFLQLDNVKTILTCANKGIQINDSIKTSSDNITNTQQVFARYEATEEFLENAYGLATNVRMAVEKQTNRNLFDCFFINRGSVNQRLGIVRSNAELNDNIRDYQQSLLNNIVKYIKFIIAKSPDIQVSKEVSQALDNPTLYTFNREAGRYELTKVLDTLKPLIDDYVTATQGKFTSELLDQMYQDLRNPNKSQQEREQAKLCLDAYNSNVILTHFDNYIVLKFKKAINIKDFNIKTGEDKYQIADSTASLTSLWRTTDATSVENEADSITKMAINTTPLFRQFSDTPVADRYLTFQDFVHIIAKIKDLSFNEEVRTLNCDSINPNILSQLSTKTQNFLKGKTLSSAISHIRRNPRKYLSCIFELFTNKDFYDRYKQSFFSSRMFTQDELDKMYSLSVGIFHPSREFNINVNGEQKTTSSLYSLCTGDQPDIDFYSYITQVANTIFSVKYLQYYRDINGLQVRSLIEQGVNNINRIVENTINNSIKLIKDYDEYKNELNLKSNTEITPVQADGAKSKFEYIEYIIPNTNIKAQVQVASGVVRFTDLKNNVTIRDFSVYWKDSIIKRYIDEVLKLNMTDNIEFQNAMREQVSSNNELCRRLLEFCARVHLNQYVSEKIIPKDIRISEKEKIVSQLYGNNAPKYNYQLDALGLVHGNDINTLKRVISLAKANLQGLTTGTQVKDSQKNTLALSSLSRLLGALPIQYNLQELNDDSATKDISLLTVPGLFDGVYTVNEYYEEGNDTKKSIDMSVSEMTLSNFVYDYVGGLCKKPDNSIVGNGYILLLPSVNSDKETIGRIRINLNKEVEIEKGVFKPIRDLTISELQQVISRELGGVYIKTYQKIASDFEKLRKFARENVKAPEIEDFDYVYNFNNFNNWWHAVKQTGQFSPEQVEYYNTQSPVEFIKVLVKNYNEQHDDHIELIDQLHFKDNKGELNCNQVLISQLARFNKTFATELYQRSFLPIDKYIDEVLERLPNIWPIPGLASDYKYNFKHFNVWFITHANELSKLGLGNTPYEFVTNIAAQNGIDRYWASDANGNIIQHPDYNPNNYLSLQQFMGVKNIQVIKSLIKSKTSINTTNTTQQELKEIRTKYPEWINNSGDLVIAKYELNGVTYNISSRRDLVMLQEQLKTNNIDEILNKLSTYNKLQLNPLIETYNHLDYLFTQEYLMSSVGSMLAHEDKSHSQDPLEQEAGQFNAQHKRNVSFTAAMHAFQLNTLDGISEDYNIAVIDQIKDVQSTILGFNQTIKPFDGAVFVNPFNVILENNSLGGSKAGITKKQFVHFKNEATGTGGIIKCAGFGLTNDWIRNSPFLEDMMRKMTRHIWKVGRNPFITDITKDYKGNDIVYKDLYYKEDGRYFKIEKIIRQQEPNTYTRYIREVDEEGNPISNIIIQPNIVVNSNYSLWEFFGGKNSMRIGERRTLELSNSSVENVVTAMNNIGVLRVDNINEVESQDELYQPLKHSDIHYVATAGAVKQGAANINSDKYYTNTDDYSYQRIKMYFSGIQLDKEHKADDSELSLMTQVISACAAKGYTFEAAASLYEALKMATDIGNKDYLAAVKKLFETKDSSSIKEIVVKTLIDNLANARDNGSNFAKTIAKTLIQKAKEGQDINFSEELLPLSDNTIYAKVVSTIAAYLTNSGIRQKIPGILSVLTPSYQIMKLYGERKYESFKNLEELREYQEKYPSVYDGTDINTLADINIGRTYRVTNVLGNTELVDVKIPLDYHKLKQRVLNGEITNIKEDVEKGRDLASFNVRFSDGQRRFQLWDMDTAMALFQLNALVGKEGSTNQVIEIASRVLGRQLLESEVPIAIILVRRQLQKELMCLSKHIPDVNKQYEQLLDSKPTDPNALEEWYQKYTYWINAYLENGNGDKLILPGTTNRIVITDSNFDAVDKMVRQILSRTTQIKINGELVTIDKTSIEVSPYEVILPKTFATNFGLTEFDDLYSIKNDKYFFIRRYLENAATKVDESQYQVELKTDNAKHYYLLNKKGLESATGLRHIPKSQVLTMTTADGKKYRLDSKSNTMYRINDDFELYLDESNNEIIVTNDFNFYINNLNYSAVKISESVNTKEQQDSILKTLERSKNITAKQYASYLTGMSDIMPLMEANRRYHSKVNLSNYREVDQNDPIIRRGFEKHSSFLKSLDIIAARVPAQSMQSFMPMKIVAFDNPDINTVYVSTMQILLQGSDY